MAQIQTIDVGSAPNDGTGDPLRTAGQKINANDAAINTELVATTALADSAVQPGQLGTVAFSNDFNDLDNKPVIEDPFLSTSDITAATHVPASGFRYHYAPTGGDTVIILNDTFVEPGAAQLKFVSGAVRIVPAGGPTINGSNRVASSDTVADAVFGSASGAAVSVTSATTDIEDYAEDNILVFSGRTAAANNGLFLVGTTHTTGQVDVTKIANADGSTPVVNPVNEASASLSVDLLDPLNLKSLATIWTKGNNFTVNGGTDENKDFDGSNLTNFGRPIGLVEVITGHIETVDNKNYFLDQFAKYPYDVVDLTIRTESGTCNATIDIDGAPVTGISGVAVSSTETTAAASAANSVAVGNTVHLEIDTNSSALDLRFSLQIVRT